MKVAVFGLGYVGLSNALLLGQHKEVAAVDVSVERVGMLNARKSPIIDAELEAFLAERSLNLVATFEPQKALESAGYVIVATPTYYDVQSDKFDTQDCGVIIASRMTNAIGDVQFKIFTRDLFGSD